MIAGGFWDCISANVLHPLFSLSARTVYLHATTTLSNMAGQYYSDYKQKRRHFWCQKSCPQILHSYISAHRDYITETEKLK